MKIWSKLFSKISKSVLLIVFLGTLILAVIPLTCKFKINLTGKSKMSQLGYIEDEVEFRFLRLKLHADHYLYSYSSIYCGHFVGNEDYIFLKNQGALTVDIIQRHLPSSQEFQEDPNHTRFLFMLELLRDICNTKDGLMSPDNELLSRQLSVDYWHRRFSQKNNIAK
jgi:hypothetical protein